MISLILPYWRRQAAADRSLALLDKNYSGTDVELVIIDDGDDFRMPETSLSHQIIRLPKKDIATSPLRPWNIGVKAARREIIALSCIEVLHESPVLHDLAALVKTDHDYALAAAWCPESRDWHCHTTVKVPNCPDGVGRSFLGVMKKTLFNMAGGFDEDYMGGAGYEDMDFIRRLISVGAKFNLRDDIVVLHPKNGASIKWGADRFEINRRLFYSKWGS